MRVYIDFGRRERSKQRDMVSAIIFGLEISQNDRMNDPKHMELDGIVCFVNCLIFPGAYLLSF